MNPLAWDIPIFIGWIAIVVAGAIVLHLVFDFTDRRRRMNERFGGPPIRKPRS